MSEEYVRIYGSEKDLNALRKVLQHNGVHEFKEPPSLEAGGAGDQYIAVAIVGAIGTCISTYIIQHKKRIVTSDEKHVKIEGNFTPEQIETVLKAHWKCRIEAIIASKKKH